MKKNKNLIRNASILGVSGILAGSLLATSIMNTVQAASRMYGVQQIVENLSEGDKRYDILEIVPDYAYASMGFYGNGSDAIIDGKYLGAATSKEERKSAAQSLIDSLSQNQLSVSLNGYKEQLYDDGQTKWQVVDKTKGDTEYFESRTGHFVLAKNLGLNNGNYYYSQKVSLNLLILDVDGNVIDADDTEYTLGDEITFRLEVSSGRSSDDDTEVIPATIILSEDGEGSLTSTSTDWDATSQTIAIPNLNTYGTNTYEFTYSITDNDKENSAGISFGAKVEVIEAAGTDLYNSQMIKVSYPNPTTETIPVVETVNGNLQVVQTVQGNEVYVSLLADCLPNTDIVITVDGASATLTQANFTSVEDGKWRAVYVYAAEETEVPSTEPTESSSETTAPPETTNEEPTQPSSEEPTQPSSSEPTQPSSDEPTQPSSDEPTVPSSETTEAPTTAPTESSVEGPATETSSTGEESGAEEGNSSMPSVTPAPVYSIKTITVNGEEIGASGTVAIEGVRESTTEITNPGDAKVTISDSTATKNISDYQYTDRDGDYVWVDGNGANDQTVTIPIGKIYFSTEITANNMFATKILELNTSSAADNAERELINNIHVHTYTPADLEEALVKNEISLNGMDFVYVSNSSLIATSGYSFTAATYLDKEANSAAASTVYDYTNDISLETAYNLYEYAVNTNLPVVLDWSLFANGTASDIQSMTTSNGLTTKGNNILRLAYMLRNYSVKGFKDVNETREADWTSAFVNALVGSSTVETGSYARVYNSILFNNDASHGNLVKNSLDAATDILYTYAEKTADPNDSSSESLVWGMSNIINEISNDNFYNNANSDAYTKEYSEDRDGYETIKVTYATLVKYILNFNHRRVTLYKDSIKVLDIEPTKYSELSESDIRAWLGIGESYEIVVTGTEGLSFEPSSNRITGSKGAYASSKNYTHNWSTTNASAATASGSTEIANVTFNGSGTVQIKHHYYYVNSYDQKRDEHTETITFSVTKNEAAESGIKEIKITQMSTSEFIGKMEDLVENYDMIYIGACIGPANVSGSMHQNNGVTKYNDTTLNGKIYLHVGDSATLLNGQARGLLNAEKRDSVTNVKTRYSGNDITEDKYNELLEYALAGYPIVFDSDLYNGTEVNTTHVDNSSYLYKLIKAVASGYTQKKTISDEEYNNLDPSEQSGYTKSTSYTYTHTYTKGGTDYKLTKITDLSQLNNANAKYIIANANTSGSYAYYLINNANLSLSNTLVDELKYGGNNITIARSILPSDYFWSINANFNYADWEYRATIQSLNNSRYLNCSSNNNSDDGANLLTSRVALHSSEQGNSNRFRFYATYGSGWDEYNSYLNARGGKAGTYNRADSGSTWYIYKVEEVGGTTVTVTEAISKEEYNLHQGEEGYVRHETVAWTHTESQTGVPNVMSDGGGRAVLTKLVKYINMPRLNMVMVSVPTEYSSTTDSNGNLSTASWLQPSGGKYYLNYEFEFSNTAESSAGSISYTAELFVDVNADGRYIAAEELDGLEIYEKTSRRAVSSNNLKSGVRYTLKRELPQDYVGLLPWKLAISMNTTTGTTTVRSSAIGYTAVPNKSSEPTLIKVLQIIPPGGLNLNEYGHFKNLIGSVETKLKYKLNIEVKSVSEVESEFSSGRYRDAEAFYEGFLKKYDMLIWGYKDAYDYKDFSQSVIDAFSLFIQSGKSTLFSHDLTSFNNGYYGSGAGSWGYRMNQYLRSAAGMDRYGITENELYELKQASYNTTPYSMNSNLQMLIAANNKDIASAPTTSSDFKAYMETQGFTNGFINRYLSSSFQSNMYGNTGNNGNPITTSYISQTNEGQITKYPFNVDINLVDTATGETYTTRRDSDRDHSGYYKETVVTQQIASTHNQYYQLDFNYDTDNDGTNNLVVWYTLAGGKYDTIPNDVRNNYYIYSVGNVTYTGMGHSTDAGDLTLAEEQLFVNTIVAAYNAGTKNPSLNIITNVDSKSSSLDYIYRTFDEDAPADNDNDESFAFYVNDTNLIQGSKAIDVAYYREIGESSYNAAEATYGSKENANKAGYYKTVRDDGSFVYLQEYSNDSSSSNYIGDVLSAYVTTVANNTAVAVTVKSDWINDHLSGAAEGNATIWIGARTTLSFTATNKADETTERVFDCVTFKKRNLIELD